MTIGPMIAALIAVVFVVFLVFLVIACLAPGTVEYRELRRK